MEFYLKTDYPVARDSLDYIYPQGAAVDNNKKPEFMEELKKYPGSVLDLGCAGGGFIEDCINEGRPAVGLEGCDYDKKYNKFAWATIPNNLFNCDISKPFVVHTGDKIPYQFDIVTMWEVFEHIEKRDIDQVFQNIRIHLKPNGLYIASISGGHSPHSFYRDVDMHRTRERREWWIKQFNHHDFIEQPEIEESFMGKFIRESRTNYKLVMRKDG
jgi:2-polyprenyl-3-methyl-5-hydroxy-6-metoxy-1,4-benzoquinol methylase